jgi:glucose-1-phosphate adenylyltransferase
VTVAALRAPIEQADQFGVVEAAADGHTISAFREKPKDAVGLPDAPDQVFASMGNYIFTTEALMDAVRGDAARRLTKHDMGGNIVPMLVEDGSAHVYDFSLNTVPGETDRDRGYWRDVGTLDAFYDAHMDLISVHPVFNLYNREWPILTWPDPLPPAKFVFEEEDRVGQALDSMVCAGRGHLGRDRRRSVPLAGRAPALLRRGGGLDPLPGLRRRALRRPCTGRSSTRTCACSRAPRSASTTTATARASSSPTGGSS